MKRICISVFLFFLSLMAFCQSDEDILNSNIDDLFSEVDDIEVPVIEEKPAPAGFQSVPLTFSGSLTTDLGIGYIWNKDSSNKKNGYFAFDNYIFFSAFPISNAGVRGTVKTSFPDFNFNLYELYLDYLLLDKIYITAGKKETCWGYVRIFTTSEDDEEKELKNKLSFETNILSDSRNGMSIQIRIPFWTGTITGIALYNGNNSEPGLRDMSYAGSLEITILNTSLNFFGRMFPEKKSPQAPENNGLKVGSEIKKSLFGADFYVQFLSQFSNNQYAKDLVKKFDFSKESFGDVVYTAGFYRLWDEFDPQIGINIEFQDDYAPLENFHQRRVAVDGGIKRLGPHKNIKIGMEWIHSITDKDGYLKPGLIVSGVAPWVDWDTGVKFEYENGTVSKITAGTYLRFNINY